MAEVNQENPVDFPALVEAYEGEESALMLIEFFEQKLANEHELLKLLDAVIYEDFPQVKAIAHTIKGSALQVNAKHMSKIAESLQNAGMNREREIAKEKLTELILETQKVHRYLFELLKRPEEEAEKTILETYEVVRIYSKENMAFSHFNMAELVENYGDEEAAVSMLEMGLSSSFKEDNFFELFYKHLMDGDLHGLDHAAHKMKGRCNYVSATRLVEVCNNLKVAAREGKEQDSYAHLITVIDESLFMERYIMINKFLKDEPTEKWINLRPELVKLLENRQNLPDTIKELKDAYKSEGSQAADANKGVEGPNTEGAGNIELGSGTQPEPQQGETKSQFEDIAVKPPHFHENSIRTVLEAIPEEKEKEELKQNENFEQKSNPDQAKISEASSPEMNNYGSSDAVLNENRVEGSSYSEEENKRREEPQIARQGRTATHINKDLEEIKERQEESLDSPTALGKISNRTAENKEEVSPPRSSDIKLSEESNPDKAPTVVIIKPKAKKMREFQASDDDYPFDSGLKCNIF